MRRRSPRAHGYRYIWRRCPHPPTTRSPPSIRSSASGSPRLKHAVTPWKASIEAGITPGELVNANRNFPEMFANLYNTGEQSGQLDDALKRLQNYYEEEGFRKLRLFTRIMNGTIYGLVALLVAFSVIRFYVGYFGQMFNGAGF